MNSRIKVHVYSRHNTACGLWKGSEEARAKNATCDNARNGCGCPKLLAYRMNHKNVRRSAGTGDLGAAQTAAAKLELELLAAAAGEAVPDSLNGSPKLLEDARDKYLAYRRTTANTEKHIGKLALALERFLEFCHGKGIATLHAVSTDTFVEYRARLMAHEPEGQGLAQETARKRLDLVIGLFDHAVQRGWLQRNPGAVDIVRIARQDSSTPKALSDEQFNKLLAAVAKVNGESTPADRAMLRSIILLARWSGLGNRDALFIERRKFQQNGRAWKLEVNRMKTGRPVNAIIPNEIMTEIMAGARPNGKHLFVESVPETESGKDAAVAKLGVLISKLNKAAKLTDEDGQPWRFTFYQLRHTFVRWALDRNITVEDIAALLGNSPSIVQQSYMTWIAARAEMLERRMYAAHGLQ